MGLQGLLVVGLPAPFIPHSTSLGPATATRVLSAPAPISAPPTGLDVCFGLPCRWIFCLFWLGEEAQCVYLRRHLGSPRESLFRKLQRYRSEPAGLRRFRNKLQKQKKNLWNLGEGKAKVKHLGKEENREGTHHCAPKMESTPSRFLN